MKQSISELEARGHEVELAGVFYHVGENDMSWGPFRQGAAERVTALVKAVRQDLGQPQLPWFISQQPPTDHESVNRVDVAKMLADALAADEFSRHIRLENLPMQREQLVLDAAGVVWLGERLAEQYLAAVTPKSAK